MSSYNSIFLINYVLFDITMIVIIILYDITMILCIPDGPCTKGIINIWRTTINL